MFFFNVSPAGELGPIKKLKDGKYHLVGDLAITPRILLKPMYAAFFTFTSSLRFRLFRGTFWSRVVKTTHSLCQSAGERRRDKAGRLRYHGRVGPDRQDGHIGQSELFPECRGRGDMGIRQARQHRLASYGFYGIAAILTSAVVGPPLQPRRQKRR